MSKKKLAGGFAVVAAFSAYFVPNIPDYVRWLVFIPSLVVMAAIGIAYLPAPKAGADNGSVNVTAKRVGRDITSVGGDFHQTIYHGAPTTNEPAPLIKISGLKNVDIARNTATGLRGSLLDAQNSEDVSVHDNKTFSDAKGKIRREIVRKIVDERRKGNPLIVRLIDASEAFEDESDVEYVCQSLDSAGHVDPFTLFEIKYGAGSFKGKRLKFLQDARIANYRINDEADALNFIYSIWGDRNGFEDHPAQR